MLVSHPEDRAQATVEREDLLRVVVWNVARKEAAWPALDRLNADVCLLNEAIVPTGRAGVWNPDGTIGRDGKRRRWTAAIISGRQLSLIADARPQWRQNKREVPFHCSRPGSWVAAGVESTRGLVAAVSLYGLLDEFSDASVHRSLSEISPLVDDPRYRSLLLVGGDLNTGTQWSAPENSFNARDRNVLDRFTALGLIDCVRATRVSGRLEGCPCLDGDRCQHVRTRRDPRRPEIPYETDYLFCSRRLLPALKSCEVLATDEWFSVSDHAPIIAEFDLRLVG